ncbi:hypothetical protein CMI37_36275 [Candidatus Pacearchaeota archaeon]|nr:hypothetical protein [Candidatus Pacearchaeota archaeon]
MARNKKKAASSDFTSIGSVIDVGERAEIEVFRGAPSTQYPEESFFLACRKTGTRGSFLKIDSEGLTDLRKWVNGAEYKDLLSRVEASEAGRSTPETKTKTETAAPSPGAGLAGLDDRIAQLINCGIPLVQAQAMLGQKAPPVLRPVHKTSSVDLIAELSHGDPVLETVFANMSRSDLAKAATASRS